MRQSTLEQEIREQPAVLARNAPRYASELRALLAEARPELVVLAARGSSDHAALYARYLIEVHLQIPVSLAAPSVVTRYGRRLRYPQCLVVGISQSGAAPDVAEVLAAAKADGHLALAITNTPGSRIGNAASFELDLQVGSEKAVAATKTYTATLLAMYQLVRAMGATLPDPVLPDAVWIERCRVAAIEDAADLAKCEPLFVLGRGFSFCTASESALKLMECALISAKSYSTADFEHGPRALAGPGSGALIFGDAPENLKRQGATVFRAPEPPAGVPEELAPIWQAPYSQWLAVKAARKRGLDPDMPRFIHKVTETS